MKTHFLKLITVSILLILGTVACTKNVTEVALGPKSLELAVGGAFTLRYVVIPENSANQNVIWESSNPNVATVENGTVFANVEGETMITITTVDGGHKARSHVKVIQIFEPEMVSVEGGTFTMGCTDDECLDVELPAHQVTLRAYSRAKSQITQKQWVSVMGYNPSYHQGDDLPVENVSWYDAQNFISRLNALTGKYYCLPTEAQWEFAARGGNLSQGFKYSGSNNLDEVAWYGAFPQETHPVGTKMPNELGIYDMSGNVYEWVNDIYGHYSDLPQTDPQGPYEGSYRLARGGAYYSIPEGCRVSYRDSYTFQSDYREYLGFRLIMNEVGIIDY
jgi:formylglycine-generating enzyme required for sulfatase activity